MERLTARRLLVSSSGLRPPPRGRGFHPRAGVHRLPPEYLIQEEADFLLDQILPPGHPTFPTGTMARRRTRGNAAERGLDAPRGGSPLPPAREVARKRGCSKSATHLAVLLVLAAFCAGFVDSIAGGGGLISVPALLLAGASPVEALATNKLQGTFGAATATLTYARAGQVRPQDQLGMAAISALAGAGGALVAHLIR